MDRQPLKSGLLHVYPSKTTVKHKKECFMKNTIKWFGIIALVAVVGMALSVTSCSAPGGTLTVKNGSSKSINYSVNYIKNGMEAAEKGNLESGKSSKKYVFDEDKNITVYFADAIVLAQRSKYVTLTNGEDVTVTITDEDLK